MTDLTAKLREVLPCAMTLVLLEPGSTCDACSNCLARAKVEAVVREMVAEVEEALRRECEYVGHVSPCPSKRYFAARGKGDS